MIVGLSGTLAAVGDSWVHLTIGGVTLRIFPPVSEIAPLGAVGSQVSFFTHLRIRDDQPVLYGFSTAQALELFLATQGVSGVGPRLALAMLSGLGTNGLQRAVVEGDVAALSGIPGVGRRIASRIVLELKGKLEPDVGPGDGIPSVFDDELSAALTALGYSTAEVRQTVAKLSRSPELTIEDYIRQALLQLGGG